MQSRAEIIRSLIGGGIWVFFAMLTFGELKDGGPAWHVLLFGVLAVCGLLLQLSNLCFRRLRASRSKADPSSSD